MEKIKNYLKNREKRLKQMKEYYKDNKEKIKIRKQKKYLENKEDILKKQKEHYEENRKSIIKKQKEYYWKNKISILKRMHEQSALKPKIYKTNKNLNLSSEQRKERIKARDYARNFKMEECGICKTKDNLEIHHWNYNKPYKNNFNTLCKTCHKIQHIKHFNGGL